jgi:hypothetical protein
MIKSFPPPGECVFSSIDINPVIWRENSCGVLLVYPLSVVFSHQDQFVAALFSDGKLSSSGTTEKYLSYLAESLAPLPHHPTKSQMVIDPLMQVPFLKSHGDTVRFRSLTLLSVEASDKSPTGPIV